MADGSEPTSGGTLRGRSGRTYRVVGDEPVREGPRRRVTPVSAEGPPPEPRAPRQGQQLALVESIGLSQSARASMEREQVALRQLSAGGSASPAPRLYDETDDGAMIVDWCPETLESWWLRTCGEPDGFRNLCLAMAESCRRVGDWRQACREHPELADAPPRLRPRSILRTEARRWVLSDLGAEDGAVAADEEAEGGTEVMTTASAYAAPEDLFLAKTDHPQARLTWALGATFLALLRLRALRRPGADGRPGELPAGGTDSAHFRSHRATLLEDLLRRKPGLFVDRPLDPRQFLYPDRLPDRDRRQVADAVRDIFGAPQEVMEGQLAKEILRVLDSALSIDPARRYLDPVVMAGDFDGLARRFRQMRATVASARFAEAPGSDDETRVLGDDPPTEEQAAGAAAQGAAGDASPAARAAAGPMTEGPTAEEAPVPPYAPESHHADPYSAEPVDDEPVEDAATSVDAAPSTPPGRPAAPEPVPAAPVPRWVPAALVTLTLSQLVTLGLVGALWLRLPPAEAGEPLAPSADPALQDLGDPPAAPPAEAPLPEQPPRDEPLPEDSGLAAAEQAPADDAPADDAPADDAPADDASAEDAAGDEAPAEAAAEPEEPAAAPTRPTAPPPPTTRAPDAEEAARTSTGRSAPAASTPTTAAPGPAAEDASVEPAGEDAAADQAGGTASVTVEGAQAYLVGPDGRTGTGSVPAGTYEVWTRDSAEDEWARSATITVAGGDQAVVRCGFGQCRRVR